MTKLYPAAVIAIVANLIDARQRAKVVDFSTETISIRGDRYTVGRSNDFRTLAVTYEASDQRKTEISREIRRHQERIAQLKPIANQKFDKERKVSDARKKTRTDARSELARLEKRVTDLVAEGALDGGNSREEFDIVALAETPLFALTGILDEGTEEATGDDFEADTILLDVAVLIGAGLSDEEFPGSVLPKLRAVLADRDTLLNVMTSVREKLGIALGDSVLEGATRIREERDALKEERDALKEERDALKAAQATTPTEPFDDGKDGSTEALGDLPVLGGESLTITDQTTPETGLIGEPEKPATRTRGR